MKDDLRKLRARALCALGLESFYHLAVCTYFRYNPPEERMHVDVSDILAKGEGSQVDFTVADETPELEGLKLTAPLAGHIKIIGTKDGVLTVGRLEAEVELECDRCLRLFTHHLRFPVQAEFRDAPEDDQFLIDAHGRIDLAEPVRQEIEVHLPLQRLCQDDCSGLKLKQKKDT